MEDWNWLRWVCETFYEDPLGAGCGYEAEALAAAEQRVGSALPLSLRTWYSLAGRRAAEAGSDCAGGGWVPFEELKPPNAEGLLVVWANWNSVGEVPVPIAGGDPDPAVVLDHELWGLEPDSPLPPLSVWIEGLILGLTVEHLGYGEPGPLGAFRPDLACGDLPDLSDTGQGRLEEHYTAHRGSFPGEPGSRFLSDSETLLFLPRKWVATQQGLARLESILGQGLDPL